MIDLHAHILPGVDDGSQSLEDSLALADLAVEGGVTALVATPHSNQRGNFENYNCVSFRRRFADLQKAIDEEGIPLELMMGMEIFCTEDVAELIEDRKLLSINRTGYYLIEFAFDEDPGWMGDRLEEVLELGKTPLVAHPERYHCIQEYPLIVYEWLRMGCRIQTNKGSILGRFGRRVQRTAQILLEQDLVTCVASDAHSPYSRTTYMADVRSYLNDEFGEAQAYRLLEGNPDRIVHDRPIPMHGAPYRERQGLF